MIFVNETQSYYGISTFIIICVIVFGGVYVIGEKSKQERLDFQAKCFDSGGNVIVHTGNRDRCFTKEIILDEYYKAYGK